MARNKKQAGELKRALDDAVRVLREATGHEIPFPKYGVFWSVGNSRYEVLDQEGFVTMSGSAPAVLAFAAGLSEAAAQMGRLKEEGETLAARTVVLSVPYTDQSELVTVGLVYPGSSDSPWFTLDQCKDIAKKVHEYNGVFVEIPSASKMQGTIWGDVYQILAGHWRRAKP